MFARELEPELMDDPDESRSYDDMDHAAVNRKFVDDLFSAGPPGTSILDLGTGTARIPIELCQRSPGCSITASDAAVSMLEIARSHVATAGLPDRIQLHHGDSKQLGFDIDRFDCVISNSLLHHLAEPLRAMREMVRVLRAQGRIFVRDLMRPDSKADVETLVTTYAGHESSTNQQLLRQSLCAALTLAEMRELVGQLGLPEVSVQATSDRHWTWSAVKS